jgi:hypothetical protein
MDFLPFYQDYLSNALSKSKFLLLRILVWLLQVHKQVRIERLAAYLPIPRISHKICGLAARVRLHRQQQKLYRSWV